MDLNTYILATTLNYKSLMIRKMKLRAAWERGTIPKAKILKGHKRSVSMIKMHGDLLVTASWDMNVKIWKKLSSKPRYFFDSLAWVEPNLSKKILMSTNFMQGKINSRISECKSECAHLSLTIRNVPIHRFTIRGHTSLLSDIQLIPSGGIATSSYDGTIKIWNSEEGTLVRSLDGHNDGVVCIDICGDK